MAPERHFKVEPSKPLELYDTLQRRSWGYDRRDNGHHKNADDVMEMLEKTWTMPANLMLNTGPLPGGAIYPKDVETLREVGRRLRA